jgi:superfamily II DNA or RNA helicase
MYKRKVNMRLLSLFHPIVAKHPNVPSMREYQEIKKFLYTEDAERLMDGVRIASILKEKGLVPSLFIMKEKKPAEMLADKLQGIGYRTYLVTGVVKGEERKRIFDLARRELVDFIVTTVVGDEGLDIPSLRSEVIMSGGISSTRFLQRVGRVVRPWKDKKFGLVIDFADQIWFFSLQAELRRRIYALEPAWTVIETESISGIKNAIEWVMSKLQPTPQPTSQTAPEQSQTIY